MNKEAISIIKLDDIAPVNEKYKAHIQAALDMAEDEAVHLGERMKNSPQTVMNQIKRIGLQGKITVKTAKSQTYIVKKKKELA